MVLCKDIGRDYEQMAAAYLKKCGYKIIERNYFVPDIGEIDIIAKDKFFLVFVEVKFRSSKDYGAPGQFVNKSKQLKITKTALCYIKKNNIRPNIRFDVVSICANRLEHIKNAFCIEDKNYYF